MRRKQRKKLILNPKKPTEKDKSLEDSTNTPNDKDTKTNERKRIRGGSLCEVCNKKLRSRYHLKLHMAVHTGEKNYVCGICKKGFQQKWNLVTHVARVHSKQKPFKCNDCGKAFGYSSHFKRHVKTHFLEKIEAPDTVKKRILNPYKCRFCEKSFESNYRLDLHVRTHTGIKPYVCDKCGKSFTDKRICAVHMQKKHSTENLQGDLNGKSFVGKPSFVIHLKNGDLLQQPIPKGDSETQASGECVNKKELVPCEVCGKSITRGSVKKHLNIHYRKRVYSCRFCPKEFLESGQRMVHERKHTGEKPYLCDICGRGHTQYGNLLTHRKRYHNLTEKTPQLWKRKDPSKNLKTTCVETVATKCDKKNTDKENLKTTDLEESQAEIINDHENLKKDSQTVVKPKYTGNETLEEFLKIASKWVNKKFQESKQERKKADCDPSLNVKNFTLEENEFNEDDPEPINEEDTPLVSSEEESQNTIIEEVKPVMVKEVKRKINQLIYQKIVENLKDTPAKDKVQQVVEKINEMASKADVDVLKMFIKFMKTIPDNIIMKTSEGKLFWHCWMCESKLRSRHLLSRHLFIHEPEENRPYKCKVCQKTFTQSNNYKEHTMTHYNENQYYCDKCGNGFRHKSHFNMHMKKHDLTRAEPPPKKYECTFCGKKMQTNYQKIEHERTHTRERPFLCKVCGQQFTASSTLNRHQSIHTSATHQCTICLKFFRQKSSLKRHYDTHATYPYSRISCECGKSFSQSPSLKKHKMICKNRTEPVVKPFECLACSKRFLTKSDLKRHVATHDSSKKFKCSICLTLLKTDETFKRHMRRHDEIQNEKKECLEQNKTENCVIQNEAKDIIMVVPLAEKPTTIIC